MPAGGNRTERVRTLNIVQAVAQDNPKEVKAAIEDTIKEKVVTSTNKKKKKIAETILTSEDGE